MSPKTPFVLAAALCLPFLAACSGDEGANGEGAARQEVQRIQKQIDELKAKRAEVSEEERARLDEQLENLKREKKKALSALDDFGKQVEKKADEAGEALDKAKKDLLGGG